MNTVIREMVLDLAEGLYELDFMEHVPGVLNVVPDILSRWSQPGATTAVPTQLGSARRATPQRRCSSWWASALDPETKGAGRPTEIH